MKQRLRDRLLTRWAGWVTAHPWAVIIVSLALAGISILVTTRHLTFQSERSDLVDPDRPWNARYAAYKEQFPHWNDVVVAVSMSPDTSAGVLISDPGLRPRLVQFLQDLADSLKREPSIASVMIGHNAGPRGVRWVLCEDDEEYRKQRHEWEVDSTYAQYATLTEYINARRALVEQLQAQENDEQATKAFNETMWFLARHARESRSGMPDPGAGGMAGQTFQPYFSRSGAFAYVSVSLATDGDTGGGVSVAPAADGIQVIRSRLQHLLAREDYAEFEAGVTGITAIESDETAQSIRDATFASILAAALIGLLLVFVFRGFVLPLVAMVCLCVGIAWSFGYLTLAVGHLQVLSVVFTVILLGLGIDFALHLVAQLEALGPVDPDDCWAVVFRNVGPGIVTGALTTAAAFGVTAFTDFKGMAEMGLIASVGILLCLVAVMCLVPAVLTRIPGWHKRVRAPQDLRWSIERTLTCLWQEYQPSSVGIILAGCVVMAAVATGVRSVHFDADIMNLHAPGVESVTWERRLMEAEGMTAWNGLSIAPSLDEARDRTLELLRNSQIGSVGGIGSLFHPDWEARRQEVLALLPSGMSLPTGDASEQSRPGDTNDIGPIAVLAEWAAQAPTHMQSDISSVLRHLQQTEAADGQASGDRLPGNTYRYRRALFLGTLAILSDPSPMGLDDLPEVVRQQDVGRDGSLLLRISPPKHTGPVLESAQLEAFVGAMRTVDPNVMGPAVQIHESSRLIVRSYIEAAVWAVCIILVILLADFRSVPDALCAVLPVCLGFVCLFGLMGWWGIPLNFANIIVLPIIFGIGVDAGVHVVHRWRLDPAGIPCGLTSGTARGISLTMLTTIIGFACMMTAHHRGIQTLGLTMTLGLAATWAVCFSILPAVLAARRAHNP